MTEKRQACVAGMREKRGRKKVRREVGKKSKEVGWKRRKRKEVGKKEKGKNKMGNKVEEWKDEGEENKGIMRKGK